MANEKRILFIDRYADIRDLLAENVSAYQGFDVTIVPNLDEAEAVLSTHKFDGIVMDGLERPIDVMRNFIEQVRTIAPDQPIVALISTADFGLNSDEKKKYLEMKVSIAKKMHALAFENLTELFSASCHRGLGEEIWFQTDTPF